MTKLLFAILLLAATSCTGSEERTYPKRRAFPRVETYAPEFRTDTAGSVIFQSNAHTGKDRQQDNWLSLDYPKYKATAYLSALEFDDDKSLAEAIANRRQRMSLNLGGAVCRTDNFRNGNGFDCELVTTGEAVPTPVQFIATDSLRRMVSCTVVFKETPKSTDSIAPIVKALEDDMYHLLQSLR